MKKRVLPLDIGRSATKHRTEHHPISMNDQIVDMFPYRPSKKLCLNREFEWKLLKAIQLLIHSSNCADA